MILVVQQIQWVPDFLCLPTCIDFFGRSMRFISSAYKPICLLRDFDEQIFTRHLKDELKDKDERLELWQKPKTSTIWLYDFE